MPAPTVVDRRGGGAGRLVQGARASRREAAGAGDSSTTFWCRRWIEQSRSPSTEHAGRVADDLHLDVAAVLDVRLDEDGAVAEGALGLGARRVDLGVEVGERADDPHPAPAAARRRLDQQGQVAPRSASIGASSTGTPAFRIDLLGAAPWSPSPRSTSATGPPRSGRRRSRRGRSRRSRTGSRSRGGPRRRRTAAPHRRAGRSAGRCRRARCRAGGRRRRPRGRRAGRRPRRSAPRRSRCRGGGRCANTRRAISPRLATSSRHHRVSRVEIMSGTPRSPRRP